MTSSVLERAVSGLRMAGSSKNARNTSTFPPAKSSSPEAGSGSTLVSRIFGSDDHAEPLACDLA